MVVPYAYNRLSIGGGTDTFKLFEADITVAPFAISYEGGIDATYMLRSQRLQDFLTLDAFFNLVADDTKITPTITTNIGYKNYFTRLGNIPLFAKGELTLNLSNTEFPYSGGGMRFSITGIPNVGFGVGRMYDITHVIFAKLYLEALGIEVKTSTVKAAMEVTGKGLEFANKLRANNGLNHIAYYTELMKALSMEGRFLEYDAVELSQLFQFEQDKFDFSRMFGLTHGWEIEVSAEPNVMYAQITTPTPVFTFDSLNIELDGEYATLMFNQTLYGKLGTNHVVQYIPGGSPEWLYLAGAQGEVRYFPHKSRWWVGTSGEVTYNSETTQFNIVFDANVHYLITPNFEVYLGGNNYMTTTPFSDYHVYVGADLRLL